MLEALNDVKSDFRLLVAGAPEAFDAAEAALPEALKDAMRVAVSNLTKFHTAQRLVPVSVETMKGILCEQVTRPIDSVGLYIPGGTAPLFSTALMLLIPAQIAYFTF